MSCGHDNCTCDYHTDTPDTGHDRHLPTVIDERPAERGSGCCGGSRHTDEATPTPAPTR